jgi:formate hydrogenlyase subunit 4
MTVLFGAIAFLLHAGVVFAAAPLLVGLTAHLRARLLGRPGPAVIQPLRDLRKLVLKTTLQPETASDLFGFLPLVALAAMGCAVLLVPSFCTGLPSAPLSDLITIAGLVALARAATILGGLEGGSGFGGAGAARDALFSVFSEAALLSIVLALALVAGASRVDAIALALRAHASISVSLGFALAAFLAVALAECGRMPLDNPAGHLELGMVHEAMLLEYSGRNLAAFQFAAALRHVLFVSLIGTIFFPFLMGRAGDPLSWPLGLVTYAAKLGLAAAALALLESTVAKMRVFRVPEFLGAALLLALLGSVFVFVTTGLGL